MILWRPVLHGSSLFSFWFRGNSSTGIIKSCLISHPVEELQMHLFIFCDSSGSGEEEERAWWRCWQQWQGELGSPNCTGRAEVWFLASQSAFPLVPCFECWVQLVGLHLYFQCIWVQPCGREAQCLGRGKLREPRSFLINHQRGNPNRRCHPGMTLVWEDYKGSKLLKCLLETPTFFQNSYLPT